MKMRKILSFVLVLSLVLGSFSMAFAATPSTGLSDIAGNANETAIQVNNDLGIITGFPDGTFLPEKAVTRAEFAAMITRALAVPESALAGYNSTTFKDTAGYGWAVPYLAFAQSKGIMIGDGQGNVMPGRTINMNEAVTMVLRALGYVNHSAELVGTWPSNYVTVAQNAGLYDDVAASFTVDRASAAQIIYNALTVEKVVVDADGKTEVVSGANKNLLTANLNCEATTGQTIGIDVTYGDAKMNITSLLGAYGTTYKQKSGDKLIVAFEPDSTMLKGKVTQESSSWYFTADGVKYNLNDTDKKFNYILDNAASQLTTTAVTPDTSKTLTIHADVSGKTIKTLYSQVKWTEAGPLSDYIDSSDLKNIKDGKLFNKNFEKDLSNEVKLNSFLLVGVTSLSDIAEDDVVYVYADNNYIRKVAVSNETVTGTVTEIKDTDKFYVGGKAYEFAAAGIKKATTTPSVGDEVKFYLDPNGDIFDYDEISATASLFGVMTAFQGSNTFNDAKAKIYTSDDTSKTFNFIALKDVAVKNNGGTPLFTTSAGLVTEASIVGYGVDSDGKIDAIENGVSKGAVTMKTVKVLEFAGKNYEVSKDVVVFTHNVTGGAATAITGAGLEIGVTTVANLETVNVLAGATQFMVDKDGKVVAILTHADNAEKTSDDVMGVVTSVSEVKDGDDVVSKIVALIDGVEVTKLTTKAAKTDAENAYNGGIALYNFTPNADGKVKGIGAATALTTAATVTAVNGDRTLITVGDTIYTVASDAVVYKAILKIDNVTFDKKYEVASLRDISEDYLVYLYDADYGTSDVDNIADVVIFVEK